MAEWPGALFTRRKGAFEMFSEVLEDQFCLESQSRQVLPAIFLMYRIVRHLLFKVQTRWSARVFFSDLRIQIVVFRPSYSNRGIQITVFRSAVFKSKTPGSRIAVALQSHWNRTQNVHWRNCGGSTGSPTGQCVLPATAVDHRSECVIKCPLQRPNKKVSGPLESH